MRSVGVMGDGRTYDYTLALRGVTTTDFMTADWARIPYEVLDLVIRADRQRGARHQPDRLRYHIQAARDHRMALRPARQDMGGKQHMQQDMIVILDLGSTENTVLARAVRDLGVYSEIYPHDITPDELRALPNVRGILLNGGPNRVVDGAPVDVDLAVYSLGIPTLSADHPTARGEALPHWPKDPAALTELLRGIRL